MIARRLTTTGTLLLGALIAAGCSDLPTGEHDAHAAEAAALDHNAQGGAARGTTPGWMDGETVTFFYNKDYFCAEPPSSGATSNCELGAEAQVRPRGGNIPVVYVLTPLFSPAPADLHCPVAGSCINHPSTIDLSRVFGPGTENAALPPHSHVVDRRAGGWWEIEVIGVTDPAVWARIAAAKDLDTVRMLQRAGSGITGDIPTNLFLFFNVRP